MQVADLRTTTAGGFLQLHGRVYATSYPQAAVNPVAARPYIYVVYNDDATPTNQSDDNGNLYLVRSTDGGVTWSVPARINDDVAGDQFFPNIAFVNAGERLMVSYYSRSHDPRNFMIHRRARLATLSSTGVPGFKRSFQIGPDTFPLGPTSSPFAFNYLGEYTGIAGGDGAVSTVWTDGRRPVSGGNSQYDIYFARIAVAPPSSKLVLSIAASPASVRLGEKTTVTLTAKATGGVVNDAVVHVNPTFGLRFQSATPSAGSCTLDRPDGRLLPRHDSRGRVAHRHHPHGRRRIDRIAGAHNCRDDVERERRAGAAGAARHARHQCHAARQTIEDVNAFDGQHRAFDSPCGQRRTARRHTRNDGLYIDGRHPGLRCPCHSGCAHQLSE